jgi:hypothetical protein
VPEVLFEYLLVVNQALKANKKAGLGEAVQNHLG